MKYKTLGIITMVDLISISTWLVLMVMMTTTYGELDTFEKALDFASQRNWLLYTLNYANAVIFTILNTMVFAGLFAVLRNDFPLWAVIGFVFLPVYAFLALFSYLSQLVIVPRLIEMITIPEYQGAASVGLYHLIQNWTGSTLGYIDQFSYFILGIPSLIFGVALYRGGKNFKLAGLLLAFSGVSCLLIGPGVIFDLPALISAPSMLGGILSMLAFIPLSLGLLRG
jgi:hypothetical protein